MNLGNPEFELIDPTPNVYALFINFDKTFFWGKLASRAVVRWSKRMYSCAGVCSYEGRGGLCDIALSEPLLKLRPRKDLIETLLHEMIHAFLFVTCQNQDRDGHGPTFKSHMHRINKSAGVNITVYHDFHDEVKLYQTHWWRCNGPCQQRRPHFGIVRRPANRTPGPSDYWWSSHKKMCGGTFVKIKEPENYKKKGATKNNKATAGITKFINNNNKLINTIDTSNNVGKVLKDSSNVPPNTNLKSNTPTTVVIPKKNVLFNPQVVKPGKSCGCPCNGKGHVLNNRKRTASADVVETVRNVWANKQLPSTPQTKGKSITQGTVNGSKNKPKSEILCPDAPQKKIMKIDDFFKSNATSVLKDVYGQDFDVKPSSNGKKIIAVRKSITSEEQVNGVQNQNNNIRKPVGQINNLVDCPICSAKVDSELINRHLDECLNKDVIEKLSKDSIPVSSQVSNQVITSKISKQNIWEDVPKFELNNADIKLELPESIDLSILDKFHSINKEIMSKIMVKTEIPNNSLIKKDLTQMNYNFTKHLLNTAACNKNIKTTHTKDPDALPKINTEKDVPIKIKVEEIDKKYNIKIKEKNTNMEQDCPCCGNKITVPIDQHLDECLMFFNNNNTIPGEGVSLVDTIVLDDDDEFDETLTLNATGTKFPCPCCLKMIEQADMNDHLDVCLS